MEKDNKLLKEDSIDLKEYVLAIRKQRGFIIKTTIIFLLVGLIYSFSVRPQYQAWCTIMPENQENSMNGFRGLGGLAGLAGINLNMGQALGLSSEIYPSIVKSIPFQYNLLKSKLYFSNQDTTVSSLAYYQDVREPSYLEGIFKFPGKIISWFKSDKDSILTVRGKDESVLSFTKKELGILERFSSNSSIYTDKRTGIITIEVMMPDPYAAAQLTNEMVLLLTKEATEYRIKKSQANLKFIQERYDEAKEKYEIKQRQLASYIDKNQFINGSLVRIEQERLQNEFNIAFEVYKGLATQLEQSKIQVKEDTPVFTVLQPPIVPLDKSKPKRKVAMIVCFVLGVLSSVSIIVLKKII